MPNDAPPPPWIARLDRWLAAHRPTYLARLGAGASEEAVGMLPEGLAALYRWHDGQGSGADSFLVRHWFIPLAQMDAQRRDIAKARDEDGYGPEWWSDDWFPFLDDGQGNLTCVDAASGKVLLYLNDTDERNDLAPSLDVFVTALVDSLEAGHWRIDEEGRAVVADADAFTALVKSRGVCFDAYGY